MEKPDCYFGWFPCGKLTELNASFRFFFNFKDSLGSPTWPATQPSRMKRRNWLGINLLGSVPASNEDSAIVVLHEGSIPVILRMMSLFPISRYINQGILWLQKKSGWHGTMGRSTIIKVSSMNAGNFVMFLCLSPALYKPTSFRFKEPVKKFESMGICGWWPMRIVNLKNGINRAIRVRNYIF